MSRRKTITFFGGRERDLSSLPFCRSSSLFTHNVHYTSRSSLKLLHGKTDKKERHSFHPAAWTRTKKVFTPSGIEGWLPRFMVPKISIALSSISNWVVFNLVPKVFPSHKSRDVNRAIGTSIMIITAQLVHILLNARLPIYLVVGLLPSSGFSRFTSFLQGT